MNAKRNATRVTSAEGTIRVYVEGPDDSAGRQLARTLAQREHGSVTIGKTPAPVKAQRGHTYTFTPVSVVKPAAPKAPKASRKAATPTAVDILASMSERQIAELRALLTGEPIAVPTAKREVPEFIVKAAERKASRTCETCHDYGVVRASGPKAGKPYLTPNGAATAVNSAPCPSHKAKRTA